jgi:hypothetical protein
LKGKEWGGGWTVAAKRDEEKRKADGIEMRCQTEILKTKKRNKGRR